MIPRAVALALAIGVAWAPWWLGAGAMRSQRLLEDRMRFHRPSGPAEVVAVPLDTKTISRLPASIPRNKHAVIALVIDRLVEAGAKVIVLEGVQQSVKDPVEDQAMADAITSSGRCVLGAALAARPGKEAKRFNMPAGMYARGALSLGVVINGNDTDRVRGRLRPVWTAGGEAMPLLGIKGAMELVGAARLEQDGGWLKLVPSPPGRDLRIAIHRSRDPLLRNRALLSEANNPVMDTLELAVLLDPARKADARRLAEGKLAVVGALSLCLEPEDSGDREASVEQLQEVGLTPADSVYAAMLAQNVLSGGFLRDVADDRGWYAFPAFVLLGLLFFRLPATPGALAAAGLAIALTATSAVSFRAGYLVNWLAGCAGLLSLWGVQALAGAIAGLRRNAVLERELASVIAGLRRVKEAGDTSLKHPAGDAMDRLANLVFDFLPERYQDAELLGQGGMGLVYRAHDKVRGMTVAVKVISPLVRDDVAVFKRFGSEAQMLQRLDHPGIVKVLDVDLGVLPHITTELLEGEALDKLLARGALECGRALGLARQLASAIGHVHDAGVIHRDLKPANVMILPGDRLKLLDFGLARDEDATRQTRTGDVVGTLRYMAPEQFAGRPIVPATDVYALALVICEMLVGQAPERRDSGHVLPRAQLAAGGVPQQAIDLLERSMSPEPAARPAHGNAVVAELDGIKGGAC